MIRADNTGFSLTFDNGWTVSVRYGPGYYCATKFATSVPERCANAEVAVINPKGRFEGDDVRGYTNVEDVAKIIARVRKRRAVYLGH
jgi:hypothetical protein